MRGEPVEVWTRHKSPASNPMRVPQYSWSPEATVDDVLVAPATTEDLTASIRPDGVQVDLRCYWPKADGARSLKFARLRVRGRDYEVVGSPIPYPSALTPTRWHMVVECREVTG